MDLTFHSTTGVSLSELGAAPSKADLDRCVASEETRSAALAAIRRLGLEPIGRATRFGVSVRGPADRIRKLFGAGDLATVPKQLSAWVEGARYPPRGQFLNGAAGGR